MDFDLSTLGLIALGALLIFGAYIFITHRHRPKPAQEETPGQAKRAEEVLRKTARVFPNLGDESCPHHFVITGFPPDKIGTHVNIACEKCEARATVTVEESRDYLALRDDTRDALKRARGE